MEDDNEKIEEIDLNEKLIEEIRERDDLIFKCYNNKSNEFKKLVPFKDYYLSNVGLIKTQLDVINDLLSGNDEINDELEEQNETIPEIELCKKCKIERKRSDDRDFCNKCIMILTDEANEQKDIITDELLKDDNFLKQKSQDLAIAYVKDKYKEDEKRNKFLYLKTFAKEVYNLKKLKENK